MSIHSETEILTAGTPLEEADRAVVMLHGRGARAEGILKLHRELPEAAYLAPRAANRTWYPKSFLEPQEENQPHLDSALSKIRNIIRNLKSKNLRKENIVLLGFSQGACLASEYLARNPERYGGLCAFSGGLIGKKTGEFQGDLEQTPVFIGSAENDPYIPLERVKQTTKILRDLNGSVEEHIFEGSAHEVTDYEKQRAREIIDKLS